MTNQDETSSKCELPPVTLKRFLQSRGHLLDVGYQTSAHFDRSVLTLSTAALGFSLVLLQELRPLPVLSVGLLVACWVAFLVAIASTVFSFQWSSQAIRDEYNAVEAFLLGRPAQEPKKVLGPRIECASLVAGWSLTGGLVFLLGVVLVGGIMSKDKTSEPREFKGGYVPPRAEQAEPIQEGYMPPKASADAPDRLEKGYSPMKAEPPSAPSSQGPSNGGKGGDGGSGNSGDGKSKE